MSGRPIFPTKAGPKKPQSAIRKVGFYQSIVIASYGLRRKSRSFYDHVDFRARDRFTFSVKVLSISGIFISLATLGGEFNNPFVVKCMFIIWSIIVTIAGCAKEFVNNQSVKIDPVNPVHFSFIKKLERSSSDQYRIVCNYSKKDYGLYYKGFFPETLSGSVEIDRMPFAIPDVVEKYADKIISNLSLDVVNEKKIRLVTDLQKADNGARIRLQKTCYFDDRVTNNFSKSRLRSGEEMIYGHRFMVDRDELVDLEHASDLSNQLGGSTLLLTADRALVLSEQAQGSQENASRYASTGSGSFDWPALMRMSKQRKVLPFNEFATIEIERELTEEVAFDPTIPHRTFLVGYGRYLYRNGKPELFGLTITKQSMRTLHVRHQEWNHLEKRLDTETLVSNLTCIGVLEGLKTLKKRLMILSANSDRMSVPLLMNIETAMDYINSKLDADDDVIAKFYK